MSLVQHAEDRLATKQTNSLNTHRVVANGASPHSLSDLVAASEAAYTDSQSSQENSQSTLSMSQETALSSQEIPISTYLPAVQAKNLMSLENARAIPQPVAKPEREDTRNMSEANGPSTTSNGTMTNAAPITDAAIPSIQQRGVLGATYRLDTTAGQKRTANGQIKPTSASPSRASVDYLRQTNGSPQGSPQRSPQIGQLTAQLKTRLSYAMVKVQKGWESKNINEVETLAARQASPLSTTPNAERMMASPRSNVSGSPERAGFVQSDLRTKLSPSRVTRPPRAVVSPDSLSSSSANSDIMRIAPVQRSTGLPGPTPTLAPPVDLSPRNPRRSNPPTFQKPQFSSDHRNTSNLSESSTSSLRPIAITATPPAIQHPLIRTPSEQRASAMEQDAIETLLFMSSPGNSQYRPSNQPISGSPLRGLLSQDRRRKELPPTLPRVVNIPNDDAVPISPRKKNFLDNVNLENNENIDRVLDQMPAEEESSSDEEVMSLGAVPSR